MTDLHLHPTNPPADNGQSQKSIPTRDPILDEVRQKWVAEYGNHVDYVMLDRRRRSMVATLLIQGTDIESLAKALKVSGYPGVLCSLHRLMLPMPKALMLWRRKYVRRFGYAPSLEEVDMYYIYQDTAHRPRRLAWTEVYAKNHARILNMLRRGGTISTILDTLGGSCGAIQQYLKEHGIASVKEPHEKEPSRAGAGKTLPASKETPPAVSSRSPELGWTFEEHAQHGKAAILAALFARGEMHDPTDIASVSDLLADLMHYCDQEKVDFYEALHLGRCYWKDEKSANNQTPAHWEEEK